MYKLINGWTKETVMAQVKKYNDGTKSVRPISNKSTSRVICLYENKDGNRCAIGCFIPDKHPALKQVLPAYCIAEEYPGLRELMPFDMGVLNSFQRIHDRADQTHNGDVYGAVQEFLDTRVE
jgi:hypothetical protein